MQQQSQNNDDIPRIRVIVRKRPLSQKEMQKGDKDIVNVNSAAHKVVIMEEKTKVDLTKYIENHPFKFDLVYNENTTNEVIYLDTIRPMIKSAFNKAKVTCFAYGQTGSGKTFTMLGL